MFGTRGHVENSSWYSALLKSTTLHTTKEELLEAPKKHRVCLGLPVNGSLQKKDITRAYKKACLKHHPDRGGDKEEFNRIQDAYSAIMSIHEIEEVEQNSILIDYEAILVKDAQCGLGIAVKEDAKGRVAISKIDAKVNIASMSEEAEGAIHIGDVIVSIDDDDCSDWPLSRIKGRLGPSRVQAGGQVLFTFERRIPIEKKQEDLTHSTETPPLSPNMPEIHSAWNNTEECVPEEPPRPPSPEAARPYSLKRPSMVLNLIPPVPSTGKGELMTMKQENETVGDSSILAK